MQFKCKIVNSRNHGLVLFDPYLRPLSGATQRGPGSDGNEGIFCITQSSRIIQTSPLDCFVSYQDARQAEGLSAAEK